MDEVSVIVVNWNGRALLSECLESLRKQVYTCFSTVLVDNGSTDGSVDFVGKKFPEVRIITLPENFSALNPR